MRTTDDPGRRERYMNRYLSGRNWLIWQMYKSGKPHKQIAKECGISERTVWGIVAEVRKWLVEKAKDEQKQKEAQPC